MLDSETDLIRRVPSKIAIHTGLRNTYGRNFQPTRILRKVILKPLPNQRAIDLKMVKPEDIVRKIDEKNGQFSPYDVGIGRMTLQKIENSNIPLFPTPKVIRPVIRSSQPVLYYPSRTHVPSKLVYDYMAKTVVPELLTDIKPEPELLKINPMKHEKVEPVNFDSVFGKKYTGVLSAHSTNVYQKVRLSRQNPALAARLAKIINYKKPDPSPEREVEYPADFPDLLRPYGNDLSSLTGRHYACAPIVPKIADKPRPSGPVHINKSILNSSEQSLSCALNDSLFRKVPVYFNGKVKYISEKIICHLCGNMMRLCTRKAKYKGEYREYPAYRCRMKGCQTFRAVRKILESDNKLKRLLLPVKVQDTCMSNPDFILSSLMEMPESRKRAYSLKDDEEVTQKNAHIAELNSAVKAEVEDDQEDVEWSDIGDFENVAKTEKTEIKKEECDELENYHQSDASHKPCSDLDDDDRFEVEDDTFN